MQTAENVARWFLFQNSDKVNDGVGEYISNLKLQKLLYYAQGMHLAYYDKLLFNDNIEAWTYGPVVPSVYHEYKHFGNKGIEDFVYPINNFSDAENETLYFTKDNFGQFAAWKLRDMTHEETPWKTTQQGHIITVDKIKEYFLQHYVSQT